MRELRTRTSAATVGGLILLMAVSATGCRDKGEPHQRGISVDAGQYVLEFEGLQPTEIKLKLQCEGGPRRWSWDWIESGVGWKPIRDKRTTRTISEGYVVLPDQGDGVLRVRVEHPAASLENPFLRGRNHPISAQCFPFSEVLLSGLDGAVTACVRDTKLAPDFTSIEARYRLADQESARPEVVRVGGLPLPSVQTHRKEVDIDGTFERRATETWFVSLSGLSWPVHNPVEALLDLEGIANVRGFVALGKLRIEAAQFEHGRVSGDQTYSGTFAEQDGALHIMDLRTERVRGRHFPPLPVASPVKIRERGPVTLRGRIVDVGSNRHFEVLPGTVERASP